MRKVIITGREREKVLNYIVYDFYEPSTSLIPPRVQTSAAANRTRGTSYTLLRT